MIPIQFILNFTANSSQAQSAATNLGTTFTMLQSNWETLENSFKSRMTELGVQFSDLKINVSGFGSILEDQLDLAILRKFGDSLDESFKNMMKAKAMGEITKGTDTILFNITKMVPEFNMLGDEVTRLTDNLLDLRMEGEDGYKTFKKLTENFTEFNEIVDDLKPKQVKQFQELFKQFDNADPSRLKALNSELENMITKATLGKKAKEGFQQMFGFLPTGADTIRQIAQLTGAYKVFDDAASAHTEAVKTMNQLAMLNASSYKIFGSEVESTKGAWGAINKFTTTAGNVAGRTASTTVEATEAMAELAKMRVTKNIDELGQLSVTAIEMSQAFDVSRGEAAEFIKNLTLIGGVPTDKVRGAADAMARVQDQLGLTGADAREVTAIVGSMMRQMALFGGTAKHVDNVTEEVSKLVATFRMAGLEAAEVGQIMNKMMDPSQIEENILLYHGLGMSAQDAIGMMMGDGSKLENMNEKMVDMAKQLKSQYGGNVFALQEMAKQYGMSLAQVQQLSNLSKDQLKMQSKEADLAEQAANARRGMNDQLKKVWNSLSVIMQKFVTPLLNILSAILEPLAGIVNWFANLGTQLGGLGQVIQFVLGGLLLGSLIMGPKLIGKMIKLIPGIGKAFGAASGVASKFFKGLADKASGLFKGGPLGKLSEKISKVFSDKKISKGVNQMGKAQKSPLLDQLSKLNPAQILAVGAALLMIAAGISLIILSVTQLLKALQGMTSAEILGAMGILIIIFGGMIIMLYLLSSAASAAALPLLAVGAAMLLIGLGIAVIILSMALLMNVLKGMSGPEILGGIAMLVITLAAMIVVLLVLGSIGPAVAPGILMVGIAMFVLGAAVFLIAAGIALVILAFTLFVSVLLQASDKFGIMLTFVAALIPMIVLLGGAFMVMAMGMYLAGISAIAFIGGIVAMVAILPLFLLLSWAVGGFAKKMYKLGLGVKYIAENLGAATSLLVTFASTMDELKKADFGKAIAEQIYIIIQSLLALSAMTPIILLTMAFLPLINKLNGGGQPEKEDGGGIGAVVDELVTANQYLDEINENTKESNSLLGVMVKVMKEKPRGSMDFNFGK